MNGGSKTNRFTRIKASWCSGRGRRKGILGRGGGAGTGAAGGPEQEGLEEDPPTSQLGASEA